MENDDKCSEFPEWGGYKDLEGVKKMIETGCFNDPGSVLEYAAKMSIERHYFFRMLLFIQGRIQKYFDGENKGIGLGIDSSKEIFEGLMIVPSEKVAFPVDENDEDGDDPRSGDDNDPYEQFVKDMEKAGIEYEGEYHGRFFYHGPAVRTKEKGFPSLQDVMNVTRVKLQWDNMGHDFIVYPTRDRCK